MWVCPPAPPAEGGWGQIWTTSTRGQAYCSDVFPFPLSLHSSLCYQGMLPPSFTPCYPPPRVSVVTGQEERTDAFQHAHLDWNTCRTLINGCEQRHIKAPRQACNTCFYTSSSEGKQQFTPVRHHLSTFGSDRGRGAGAALSRPSTKTTALHSDLRASSAGFCPQPWQLLPW